jgi:hypothetical protein
MKIFKALLITAVAGISLLLIAASEEPCNKDTEEPRLQESRGIKSELNGNKLYTLGYTLKLGHTRKLVEDDRVIYPYITESPDKKRAIIWAGEYITYDFWYIDREKNEAEWLDLDVGKYSFTKWHNNYIAEIQWGGMGYTFSEVFKFGDKMQRTDMKDLFYLDPEKEIYISGVSEGKKIRDMKRYIKIGRLFRDADTGEKMAIPGPCDGGLWDDIISVSVDGYMIKVCRNNCADKIVSETFESQFLKAIFK